MKAKFLVLAGDGINCEKETAHAFEAVHLQADIVHINKLLDNPKTLSEYQGMALPGGFSFGDELGSGQVLALKIKKGLYQEFYRFVEDDKPIIGICNGFQVLTRLGLLPNYKEERSLSLTHNTGATFIDKWVDLEAPSSVCHWTKNLKRIQLPVRHGEGRIVLKQGKEKEINDYINEKGLVALRYSEDINGSHEKIAALTNESGTILGLMPHPEAYIYKGLKGKQSALEKFNDFGDGYQLFHNISQYLKEK